jgi:uncharacterized protein YodC (DUF2158 family)
MTIKFEIGDVVVLKSGGEKMTVEEIDGDQISCLWSENKRIERACFNAATLKKWEPHQPVRMVRG